MNYSLHPRIKRIRRQRAIERLTAYVLLITFLLLLGFILWKIAEPGNRNYNAYMCAQYGYLDDCETKISSEKRLELLQKYQRGEVIYNER